MSSRHPMGSATAWRALPLAAIVEHQSNTTMFAGIACPSASLCVAAERDGHVAISRRPTGPLSAWRTTDAVKAKPDGELPVSTGVSCSSSKLCVIVGYYETCPEGEGFCFPTGHAYIATTTHPATPTSTWTTTEISSTRTLQAISCPSPRLCVAAAGIGQLLISSHPTGGPAAWKLTHVDTTTQGPYLNDVVGVSCASVRLCVAVGADGNAITSTHPSRGTHAWRRTHLSTSGLTAVSCVAGPLCIALNSAGAAFTTTQPTRAHTRWMRVSIDHSITYNPGGLTAVACATKRLCVAADAAGNTITGHHPQSVPRGRGRHGGRADDARFEKWSGFAGRKVTTSG